MPFFLPAGLELFPHPLLADSHGLLAFSESLDADTLLSSYQYGIFPWYHEGDPVMWWFTHPRFILYPRKLKISKSLRKFIRDSQFIIRFDTAFESVIEQCKSIPRKGQDSTWITQELKSAFIELHDRGYAHSVEVWDNQELVGGLYGLALGKVFFGESMFSKRSNASKMAFVALVAYLIENGFELIDCQQETDHLRQFGAELISAESFLDALRSNIFEPRSSGQWSNDSI
ncbi:MAG: leucyl/phenylalanyl-tRNA--protein transferase [Saprospiraceae bacterium]